MINVSRTDHEFDQELEADPELERRDDAGPAAPAAVGTWLDVFTRLLTVPDSERVAIRDELHAHLTERVRDLMIDGVATDAALSTAIAELGETAALARSFNDVRPNQRRKRMMNLTMMAAGLGIVGLGIVAVTPPGAVYTARYEHMVTPQAITLPETRVSVAFEETPLADAVSMISAQADLDIFVHWRSLDMIGLDRESQITLTVGDVELDRALGMLETEIDADLEWAWDGELLELGSAEFFDERSVELVCYDLERTVNDLIAMYGMEYDDACDQIRATLIELVSPDDWQDMGGRLARMRAVGSRFFIEAPTRMHRKIEWMLGELSRMPGDAQDA